VSSFGWGCVVGLASAADWNHPWTWETDNEARPVSQVPAGISRDITSLNS